MTEAMSQQSITMKSVSQRFKFATDSSGYTV